MKLRMSHMVYLLSIAVTSPLIAADLDYDAARVEMNVAAYAVITGLDDFELSTHDIDGAAGAIYNGSEDFHLEANTQVRVTLSASDLSNGTDSISTRYNLDNAGIIMETRANSIHSAVHTISAEAILGAISSQKAGTYSASITLTVSPL